MSRKAQTLLGFLALLLAGVSGYAVYIFFDRLTTLATLPVPAQVIPAGALIQPEMLAEREVPRALLDEPVYQAASELAGKVAQVPLQPGMIVYHTFAVAPAVYRLVDDPALVVVALPVDPARAVGGQIQPGHHIDLWQLPKLRQADVETTAITPTLVLSDVLVVDVRGSSGQAVARLPQAVPGEMAAQGTSQQQALPLQILTVAVPVTQTETLMALVAADRSNEAFLWVALAPLTRPTHGEKSLPDPLGPLPTPTPAATVPAVIPPRVPTRTPIAAPTLMPTATPMDIPTPIAAVTLDIRSVAGTGGAALVVRHVPGGQAIGELPEGATVVVLEGPLSGADGTPWYRCTQHGDNAVTGWVSGSFLEVHP
jgi:hypothetical protein